MRGGSIRVVEVDAAADEEVLVELPLLPPPPPPPPLPPRFRSLCSTCGAWSSTSYFFVGMGARPLRREPTGAASPAGATPGLTPATEASGASAAAEAVTAVVRAVAAAFTAAAAAADRDLELLSLARSVLDSTTRCGSPTVAVATSGERPRQLTRRAPCGFSSPTAVSLSTAAVGGRG